MLTGVSGLPDFSQTRHIDAQQIAELQAVAFWDCVLSPEKRVDQTHLTRTFWYDVIKVLPHHARMTEMHCLG
jgi:hypothetical protein